jgi:hypothetical protein
VLRWSTVVEEDAGDGVVSGGGGDGWWWWFGVGRSREGEREMVRSMVVLGGVEDGGGAGG